MKPLKIAWHTWEPGIVTGEKSSGGGAAWMKTLFASLRQEGAQIHWVAPDGSHPEGCYNIHPTRVAKTCDILVTPWRWRMPKYPDRDALYHQQWEIIIAMTAAKKRVIVHDQDHMISAVDFVKLMDLGVEVYEPAFFPAPGSKTLFFPNPYPGSVQFAFPGTEKYDLAYVGNNYGRFDQTVRFLGAFSAYYKTALFGNWLINNSEREAPETVKQNLPNVVFGGRLAQEDIIGTLQQAKTTIHLCKTSYAAHGFVTIRWAEAAAAGCVPFIPSSFRLPEEWFDIFNTLGLIVDDWSDMAHFLDESTTFVAEARKQSLKFVNQFMRVEPWISLLFGR